jgi:23S rRNA (guanine2445-N2)-methyltransferase / 23S rRNA (guanine2069-N7)-methyltransferase
MAGNLDLVSRIGMKETRRFPLFNGPIDCRLLRYPILRAENRPPPRPKAQARPERAEAFANRLAKNLKHLRKWAQREDIHCFRAYDRDIPEYAVAVDIYEKWVHVQEFAPPATVDAQKAEERLLDLVGAIPGVVGVPASDVFLKTRRKQKGGAQYEKVAARGELHPVREGPYTLMVNFTDHLDTGLFLDHRITRRLVGEMAKGKRFLNLFCYTATATVHAAGGGAISSTSVDLSNTYLEWAKENFRRNKLGGQHQVVRADCTAWLPLQKPGSFDLIFLDPPTFSRSKKMEGEFDIQRDHTPIIRACVPLLSRQGVILFSNNFQRFKLDPAGLEDLAIEDISARTIPEDFKRHPKVHQAWLLRKK